MRQSSRPDEAVMVVECLCDLMKVRQSRLCPSLTRERQDNTLLVDIFVSYDCSLQSTDVFENLFKYLSRLAFPQQLSSPPIDHLQMLALRGLLLGVRAMETRPEAPHLEDAEQKSQNAKRLKVRWPAAALRPDQPHRLAKARKSALVRCAEAFNEKPKHGLQALIQEGILRDPPDPLVLASFLRNTPYLDKAAVGQFLGDEVRRARPPRARAKPGSV
jgi:brefeldin A-resistance guanine nucleotide exchange factor 1